MVEQGSDGMRRIMRATTSLLSHMVVGRFARPSAKDGSRGSMQRSLANHSCPFVLALALALVVHSTFRVIVLACHQFRLDLALFTLLSLVLARIILRMPSLPWIASRSTSEG